MRAFPTPLRRSGIGAFAAARAVALAAGLTTAMLGSNPAVAQVSGHLSTFTAGAGNGRYAFPSRTPRNMSELLHGGGSPVDIVGELFLPPGSEAVPAVVLMHGSGGVYDALLDYWPKQFNAAGIAVFTLDRFGPRGVRGTTADQSLVPAAADVADAFAALRLLATHPRIDARRIALMGFSRGGTATLRTAVDRFITAQDLPAGLRYSAFVLAYSGGCVGTFRLRVRPGVFGPAPMLFIHGTADDYTPIEPCRDYAERVGNAGTPVEFLALNGAQHKFDSDDVQLHYVGRAQRTRAECPIEVDVDTFYAYDRGNGARLQGRAYEDAVKECHALGASVQGSNAARDQAAQATVAFLQKALAR